LSLFWVVKGTGGLATIGASGLLSVNCLMATLRLVEMQNALCISGGPNLHIFGTLYFDSIPICTVEIAVGRLNPMGVLRVTDERCLRIAMDDHRQWRPRHRRSVLCVRVKGRKPAKEFDVFIVR